MDIQRIKYNQELINTKIRLEKELKMVEGEIENQINRCNHVIVVLDCSDNFPNQTINNSISYCLICGINLTNTIKPMPIIDGTFYKRGLSYTDRLIAIRKILLNIKEKNPEIPDKILVDLSQEKIDEESMFIRNGYNEQMILSRRSNNINL